MERWSGRVAMVTGASAGIGAAIAKELVLKGMKVVGLARRVDRMEKLKGELTSAPGQLFPVKCDVSQSADILAAFDWVSQNLGGVDVLVNNAGIIRDADLTSGSTSAWRDIMEVNVIALSVCTREALKCMRARGVDDGHIVHISSIAAHAVRAQASKMYAASKHAVNALTEGLRLELLPLKTNIRITSVSPGAVRTEILAAADMHERAKLFVNAPLLEPKDVADAVVYALAAPPHVTIHELIIKPTREKA